MKKLPQQAALRLFLFQKSCCGSFYIFKTALQDLGEEIQTPRM